MSTIIPEGEAIRKAVRWISEQLKQEDASIKAMTLVNEAIMLFDLSPKDANVLITFYRDAQKSSS